jgi:hypothetical protein
MRRFPYLVRSSSCVSWRGVREQNTSICCSRAPGSTLFFGQIREQRSSCSASPWLLATLICRTRAAGNEELDDRVQTTVPQRKKRGEKREITDSGTAHKPSLITFGSK